MRQLVATHRYGKFHYACGHNLADSSVWNIKLETFHIFFVYQGVAIHALTIEPLIVFHIILTNEYLLSVIFFTK